MWAMFPCPIFSFFLMGNPSSPIFPMSHPIFLPQPEPNATILKPKQVHWNKNPIFKAASKMNLNQINIYMVCVPSGQLGLIQNKLCGQKPLKGAAEER